MLMLSGRDSIVSFYSSCILCGVFCSYVRTTPEKVIGNAGMHSGITARIL